MKTYKILVTMLRHQTFTVNQIAAATGLPSGTVHTVLRRFGDAFDGVVVEGSGRRGGQVKQYSLRPEGRERIKAALQRNLDGLQAPTAELLGGPPSEDASTMSVLSSHRELDPVPPVLLAAEHALRYAIPTLSGEVRQDLVRSTARKLQVSAQMLNDAEYRDNPALQQRFRVACAALIEHVVGGRLPVSSPEPLLAARRRLPVSKCPDNVLIIEMSEEQRFADKLTGAFESEGSRVFCELGDAWQNKSKKGASSFNAGTVVILTVNSDGQSLSPKELLGCVRDEARWVILDMDSDSGVIANPVLGEKYVKHAATRPFKDVMDEIKRKIAIPWGSVKYTPLQSKAI